MVGEFWDSRFYDSQDFPPHCANSTESLWIGWVLLPYVGYIRGTIDLKMRRLSRWASPNHKSRLKAGSVFQMEKEVKRFKARGGLEALLLAWRQRGPRGQVCVWPLGMEIPLTECQQGNVDVGPTDSTRVLPITLNLEEKLEAWGSTGALADTLVLIPGWRCAENPAAPCPDFWPRIVVR